MKKLMSVLLLSTICAGTAFAVELKCTNLNDKPNILTLECGVQKCVLLDQQSEKTQPFPIALNEAEGSSRATVNFENEAANLGVIVTKRGISLENAIMARVYIDHELVATCK
jgi:hypothetical protein